MKINDILFEKSYNGEYNWLPISDIPKKLLIPENNIMIHVEQGYNNSNGWNDGCTTLQISVYRDQTPEEKEEMKKHFQVLKEQSKAQRREDYLRLKEEFENE